MVRAAHWLLLYVLPSLAACSSEAVGECSIDGAVVGCQQLLALQARAKADAPSREVALARKPGEAPKAAGLCNSGGVTPDCRDFEKLASTLTQEDRAFEVMAKLERR